MKKDYTQAGFDGFLSRSIDGAGRTNLAEGGPKSTSQAFDRIGVSGSLGDTLKIGSIGLDGKEGGISLNDGRNQPLWIGKDSQGNQAVKVAKEGYDAFNARDDQLIFNSAQNTLKVVKTGVDSVHSRTTINWTTIPHNLGYVPIPLAFLNNVNLGTIASQANIPLPTYAGVDIGVRLAGAVTFDSWIHAVADITNLYLVYFDASGSSNNFNITWYLLQESAK